ncbi:MAG: DNA gyrase modulator [Cyanobacteriota bacterium]|nr:DNA gyrase modulator [Cyanobacteriota bacterium]
MSESTLEQILKLATQKAEAVEIYYLSTQETPIKFENNCLKSLQTKDQQGVALRLIYQGRLGFASSTDLTRIEDLVEGAIQTAIVSDIAPFQFASSYNFNYPKLESNLPNVNELISSPEVIIEKIHNYNADLLVKIDFNIQSKYIKIMTNTDVFAQRFNQLVNVNIYGNLVRNEDFLQISTSDAISDRPLDINKLLEKLIQKYQWAENSAKITTGNFPVFFTKK